MPRLSDEERLERAKEAKAKAVAEIRAASAKLRASDRKADTRRKIILGAMLIEEARTNLPMANWIRKKVGKLKGREKDLFGDWLMPDAPEAPPSPAPASPAAKDPGQ